VFRFWFEKLVGPPPNLNLRNILWHGFCSPAEFPAGLVTLLFSFLISSARLLGPSSARFVPHDVGALLRRTAAAVVGEQEMDWRDAVSKSFFVFPGMRSLLLRGEDEMHCCVLLAVLEQSVRQVFSFATGRRERVLTADEDCLMTTLDSMLEDERLHAWLGRDATSQMRDLFVLESGPKIRDLVSHGACSPQLPPELLRALHNMLGRCCLRFTIGGDTRKHIVPYTELYSAAALAAREWGRLTQLFQTLCAKLFPQCELRATSEFPETCPERANRRFMATMVEMGMHFAKNEGPAVVLTVATMLLAYPDERFAQVMLKALEKNCVSKIVHLAGCYIGLPIPHDRISKRERALFENKAVGESDDKL
jgi:hypothetical protein